MIESATALIDSNVIIDIVGEDPTWKDWSCRVLGSCRRAFVNPMVFAELCYLKPSPLEVEKLIADLDLDYHEIPKDALFVAAQAFKVYRRRGGSRTAPLPDFFIGAHAAVLGVPLITRDVSRYQSYFPTVPLICP